MRTQKVQNQIHQSHVCEWGLSSREAAATEGLPGSRASGSFSQAASCEPLSLPLSSRGVHVPARPKWALVESLSGEAISQPDLLSFCEQQITQENVITHSLCY